MSHRALLRRATFATAFAATLASLRVVSCGGTPDAVEDAAVAEGGDEIVVLPDGARCVVLPETCNGVDDDCNGVIDDVPPAAVLGELEGRPYSCNTGRSGACAFGESRCVDGGTVCVPLLAGRAERCNGLDDDCNGEIDDGLAELGFCPLAPDSGVGRCAYGVFACADGGISCVRNVPRPESCNGLDDDCNGMVDNPNEAGVALCPAPSYCSFGGCRTCPFVFAGSRDGYAYETTVGGAGLIGQPKQLVEGKEVEFSPIWVRLDHADIERDGLRGRARAKLVAAEDEIVYVDELALDVVEHPPDLEVLSSSSIQWNTLGRPDPGELYGLTSSKMRTPATATFLGRRDVTSALGSLDDVAVEHALEEDNFYDLDFGPVTAERARIVVDGWKLKVSRSLRPGVQREKPRIEVADAHGVFHRIMWLGTPRGDRKSVAFELPTGVAWPSGRYRMRLYTGTHEGATAMWFIDRVRLTEEEPTRLTPRRAGTVRADLLFSGVPSVEDADDLTHPRRAHDDGKGALDDRFLTFGAFTRYGDVGALVASSDDHLVVMRRGDAIEVEFEGIPPAPPGLTTTLLLRAELLFKPRTAPRSGEATPLTTHVDPLPFHGMGRYPPPADAYDSVPDRAAARARFNTRVYQDGDRRWGP